MSTDRRTSLGLLVIICIALTAYNLYSVITLKEEIAELKSVLKVVENESEQPEQPKQMVDAELEKEIEKAIQKGIEKALEKEKALAKEKEKVVQKEVVKEVVKEVEKEVEKERQPVKAAVTVKPKPMNIVPSVKVRVEDRYVQGEPELPAGKFNEEGTVVVKVLIDFMGGVTSTSIQSSTVTDEEVQYACREAALKTKFSYNVHAGPDSRVAGTITYTFSAQ
jgi:TonB family protein